MDHALFPELSERRAFIVDRVRREEERFLETYLRGLTLLQSEIEHCRYYFEVANVDALRSVFDIYESESLNAMAQTPPLVYGLAAAPRTRPMVRESSRSTSSAQVLGQSCGHAEATKSRVIVNSLPWSGL